MSRLVIRNTKTIRMKIYDHLREEILSGEIPPHAHLIETKIAKRLGTSRTPVREALHSLELEGIIESVPRVGYLVKPLSKEEVEEICEIRRVIEELAARWAMEKANQKLIEDLQQNIFITEKKASQGDPKAFIELDAQFHEIIARFSGSKRLHDLGQTLRQHMLRIRIKSIYEIDTVLRAIQGHKGILEAIKKGNVEEVNMAIKCHLDMSKEDIFDNVFKEPTLTEGCQ